MAWLPAHAPPHPPPRAQIKAVFGTGKRRVAGCVITEGRLMKGQPIVVRRGKSVVYEGPINSLRRMKDAVVVVCGAAGGAVGCGGVRVWGLWGGVGITSARWGCS